MPLKENLIENTDSRFIYDKRHAKDIKYQFVYKNLGSEVDYLNLFKEGECKLNDQRSIHRMSSASFYHICNVDHNQEQCKSRYEILANLFPEGGFSGDFEYYPFFVFKVRERDAFRSHLSSMGVYLPIHWPGDIKKNELYGNIISIPLSPVYTNLQFNYLVKAIRKFKL